MVGWKGLRQAPPRPFSRGQGRALRSTEAAAVGDKLHSCWNLGAKLPTLPLPTLDEMGFASPPSFLCNTLPWLCQLSPDLIRHETSQWYRQSRVWRSRRSALQAVPTLEVSLETVIPRSRGRESVHEKSLSAVARLGAFRTPSVQIRTWSSLVF